MAATLELDVVKKLSTMSLSWEKISDKDIWRAETQNFSVVLDFCSSETYFVYIKKKGEADVKKITCGTYAGGEPWNMLKSLREQIKEGQQKKADIWLDEFLKEETPKPKVERAADNHLPSDSLDNDRSE